MDPLMLKTIGDSIPQSTKELLFNPTANAVGQGIGAVFTAVFSPLIKIGIIKKQELADLTNKTAKKVKEIPHENLDGSKPGLVLKALEESKYQLEDKDLRDFFASLIASSVDNRKNQDITPRYATVLSQLGSQDAQFLLLLSKQLKFQLPIGHLEIENNTTFAERSISDTYLCTNNNEVLRVSMDTATILNSLGIITLSNDGERYLSHEIYEKGYSLIDSHLRNLNLVLPNKDEKIKLAKGSVIITDFGQNLFQYIF